jgi:hypothetical protein
MASDIYSIGWWIGSIDDAICGPASRATVSRFLAERVIPPNTLVCHCTEMTKRPAIDVPGGVHENEIANFCLEVARCL